MNLNKFGRWSGIVAAVAMLAMVLQGCGGDDNGSGISQDMYDALQADYDAAVTARDAAMAGQATAEAARDAAMTAQMEAMDAQEMAEAAQAAAEARRDSAVAAEAVATAAAAAAETAKTEAEATAAAAVTAKEAADAAAAAANLDVVAANAAKALAEQAQMAAETARAEAITARMAAEAAQEMAETERDAANSARDAAVAAEAAAVMAQTAAETARDAAVMAQTAAEGERDAANTARDEAIAARDAAMTARDTAIEERDAALALVDADTDAVAAQRARVDAAAIERSARSRFGVDYNNDGDLDDMVTETAIDPVAGTGTGDLNGNGVIDTTAISEGQILIGRHVVSPNYQSSQPRPMNMMLTAEHDGSMVTFTATQGSGRDVEKLIDLTVPAGSGDTSGMTIVEGLPGGHNKDITLRTDIMSPILRPFGNNVPPGLGSMSADNNEIGSDSNMVVFDAATQTSRYPVLARTANDDGVVTIAETGTVADSTTNLALDPHIDITLGGLAPTTAVLTQTLQQNAALAGEYAGVAGTFMCRLPDTGCLIAETDGEVIITGALQFIPAAANVQIGDGDFLVYGAWLKRPESQVGVGYSAGISSASVLYDNDGTAADGVNNGIGLLTVTGEATYEGNAAGHFAERFIGTDEAKSGRFTASADLTADFGAADQIGSISGSITDFVRDDGVAANWVVDLMEVAFPVDTDTTATEPNPGGFWGGSTGGHAAGANWRGRWGGELTGPGGNDLHPNGVVGTFAAEFGSAVQLTDELDAGEATADEGFVGVIGGFGARKVVE